MRVTELRRRNLKLVANWNKSGHSRSPMAAESLFGFQRTFSALGPAAAHRAARASSKYASAAKGGQLSVMQIFLAVGATCRLACAWRAPAVGEAVEFTQNRR